MEQVQLGGCVAACVRVSTLSGGVKAAQRRLQPPWQLFEVEDLIHAKALLEVCWRRVAATEDLVVFAKFGHEERGACVRERERAVAAGLGHTKEVLEVRLLTEHRLVVCVISRLLIAALQQHNASRIRSHRRGELCTINCVHRHRHAKRVQAEVECWRVAASMLEAHATFELSGSFLFGNVGPHWRPSATQWLCRNFQAVRARRACIQEDETHTTQGHGAARCQARWLGCRVDLV